MSLWSPRSGLVLVCCYLFKEVISSLALSNYYLILLKKSSEEVSLNLNFLD